MRPAAPVFDDYRTQNGYKQGFNDGFDEGYRAGQDGLSEVDKPRYKCDALIGHLWAIWQSTKQGVKGRRERAKMQKEEDTESDTEDYEQAVADATDAMTEDNVTERDRFDHDTR